MSFASDVLFDLGPSLEEGKEEEVKTEIEYRNLCIVCGEDLGESNPRQYCRKSYCPMELSVLSDEDE